MTGERLALPDSEAVVLLFCCGSFTQSSRGGIRWRRAAYLQIRFNIPKHSCSEDIPNGLCLLSLSDKICRKSRSKVDSFSSETGSRYLCRVLLIVHQCGFFHALCKGIKPQFGQLRKAHGCPGQLIKTGHGFPACQLSLYLQIGIAVKIPQMAFPSARPLIYRPSQRLLFLHKMT